MTAQVKAQNHFYDGWIYRYFLDPSLGGIRRRIAKLVPPGSRVIDIGCGTGDQLLHIADQISSGLGIELSATMIKTGKAGATKRGIDNCDFQLADATDLSHLEDQSFDLAMSSMVIHEMPLKNRLPVLREMKRLGKQIILVDWIYPQQSLWKKFSTHVIEFLAGWQHYRGYRSFIKTGGMPELINSIDLEILASQITGKGTIQLWLCKAKD